MRIAIVFGCVVGLTWAVSSARAESPSAEKFLLEGKLADGETALAAALKADRKSTRLNSSHQ